MFMCYVNMPMYVNTHICIQIIHSTHTKHVNIFTQIEMGEVLFPVNGSHVAFLN